MKATARVTCRRTTLKDYAQIHALERRYEMGFRTFAEWSHLWIENPVCKRGPELPIGWVLEGGRDEIVGSIGSVPFGFELDGARLIAATGSGWVVDERYRGYAPLLLDQFLTQPGVDLYLCVSPNSQAEPVVLHQCERVPVGVWNRAAFWITNYQGFAATILTKREARFPTLLRNPVQIALQLIDSLRRDALRAVPRTYRDLDIGRCTGFDERFDVFWDQVRKTQRHRLLAVRSREVLEWHFKHPLARHAAWITTLCKGNRLIAYSVFCNKDVTSIGLRRVRLIDYQSLDGDPSLLIPMLAQEVERCRHEGAMVLESIGWGLDRGALMDRIAPHVRTMPSWQYFYKAATAELARRCKDPSIWAPSQYDGDACV
jgi:hypothetical protein